MYDEQLIGKRIALDAMPDDPSPIEAGATGTVTEIHSDFPSKAGRSQAIDVDWDNGRTLSLVVPPDRFHIIIETEER